MFPGWPTLKSSHYISSCYQNYNLVLPIATYNEIHISFVHHTRFTSNTTLSNRFAKPFQLFAFKYCSQYFPSCSMQNSIKPCRIAAKSTSIAYTCLIRRDTPLAQMGTGYTVLQPIESFQPAPCELTTSILNFAL